MLLCFGNGSTQTYPVTASIMCPAVRASPCVVDFEQTFVGQERNLMVYLSNPSPVTAVWKAQIDGKSLLKLVS